MTLTYSETMPSGGSTVATLDCCGPEWTMTRAVRQPYEVLLNGMEDGPDISIEYWNANDNIDIVNRNLPPASIADLINSIYLLLIVQWSNNPNVVHKNGCTAHKICECALCALINTNIPCKLFSIKPHLYCYYHLLIVIILVCRACKLKTDIVYFSSQMSNLGMSTDLKDRTATGGLASVIRINNHINLVW